MTEFTLTAKDGLVLSVAYFPVENPKGCVQMIHGALEHKERYYPFIQYLNQNGYAAIISDNRGHGASVSEKYPLGYMNGVKEVISDQRMITDYIKRQLPGTKLFLFGHSLGSCFARCYLQEYDAQFAGLILCGTANYISAVPVGLLIGRLCTLFTGKHGYSKLLHILEGGDKDPADWIAYNPAVIETISQDPLCPDRFQNSGVLTVFEADYELKKYRKYKCRNPQLKILGISGADDPVTGGGAGLADTIDTLKKIGYQNIQNIVYPNMMHEVLNEEKNDVVYQDVLAFLDRGIENVLIG